MKILEMSRICNELITAGLGDADLQMLDPVTVSDQPVFAVIQTEGMPGFQLVTENMKKLLEEAQDGKIKG